jgi:hypothetical protein
VITVSSDGDFKNTEAFLKRMVGNTLFSALGRYGAEGVSALSAATPSDSGETARSWSYEILVDAKSTSIIWNNTNVVNGVPIAILIQHGHGTRNGGYVQGRDFINPALRPLFDRIANDVWKEVTKA